MTIQIDPKPFTEEYNAHMTRIISNRDHSNLVEQAYNRAMEVEMAIKDVQQEKAILIEESEESDESESDEGRTIYRLYAARDYAAVIRGKRDLMFQK